MVTKRVLLRDAVNGGGKFTATTGGAGFSVPNCKGARYVILELSEGSTANAVTASGAVLSKNGSSPVISAPTDAIVVGGAGGDTSQANKPVLFAIGPGTAATIMSVNGCIIMDNVLVTLTSAVANTDVSIAATYFYDHSGDESAPVRFTEVLG